MKTIIWVNEDCLDPQSKPLQDNPECPAIFIFDDLVIRHRGYGMKRIGFIYECLLELPVTIVRGDTVSQLKSFAGENRAQRIVTTTSPCPLLNKIIKQVSAFTTLEQIRPDPLVSLSGKQDLKRFSRYWQSAQRTAMLPKAGR